MAIKTDFTIYFAVKNLRIFCSAKASPFFSTRKDSAFMYNRFEISLTNGVVGLYNWADYT